MIQIAYAVIWWLILLVVGLITFPLVSRVCSRLPDRGYSISKILGLLLITYLSWLLASAHLLKFGYINISVSLLLLLALSFLLGRKHLNLRNLPLRSMVISEALFAIAFALFLFILSHKPDLYVLWSEDFMDFGFLNSILRSDYFPPTDPWLAGESIPYYYGGHLVTAVLTMISRVPPSIAYNLAVAIFFALAISAAYGVGYSATKRKLYGFVTVIFVCLAGFISGAFQLAAFLQHQSIMGYTPLDAPNIGEWFLSFDFIHANRIISNAVTHYPYYAYLVGDLHSNVMAIPFQLMFITLVLSLLNRGHPMRDSGKSDSLLSIFILGLSLGFLAFVYTWSYPIYLAFVVLAFLLLKLNLNKKGIVGVVALSLLLYLPYYISRGTAGIRDIGVLAGDRTELLEFFEIFALSLFATFTLFLVLSRRRLSLFVTSTRFYLLSRRRLFEHKTLIITAIAIIIAISVEVFVHLHLIWILTPLILLPLYYIYKAHPKRETQFMLLLTLTGALVALFCEIFFVDDPLGPPNERYNTILKAYMPLWVIWGVPSAYAVFYILSRLRRSVKLIWVIMLLVFLLAALVHPIATTSSWAGGRYSRVEGGRLTLDGMAYLEFTNNGDYQAIRWLQENVKGSRVILEAPGVAIEYSSQASALTGLPTLLGWAGWEVMWRDSWEIITERTMAIDTIYQTTDNEEAIALLRKYNVEYIYVGTLEKERYETEGLLKFDSHPETYRLRHENQDVTIYQVLP